MNIITARWNIPHLVGPMSALAIFTLPVSGKVLIRLSVARSDTAAADLTLCGFRVLDAGGKQIYPSSGVVDNTATLDGRGSFAPLQLFVGPFLMDDLNIELSGPPYALTFEFYNEDAADFIAFVHVGVGEDLKPLAVSVYNFKELIQPIGGLIQHLIDRLFPRA
jgi:hypothetical protein